MALLDRALVRMLPAVPRRVVQRLSSRYIAGPELSDAERVVEEANAQGMLATIDVLGEHARTPDEASAMARAYEDVFTAIDEQGLDANVSVKLSGFGLSLGYDLCKGLLEQVVRHADGRDNFVRIEMEDSTATTDTLELYRELRAAGHGNIGTVLQSSLRRTGDDVEELLDLRPNIRLVKGIYVESPEIQLRDFDAVRAAFVDALDVLLEAGCYVAVATHDDWLIEQTLERVRDRGLDPDEYEFQFLLGVKRELGARLVAGGHRVRLYVPFGRRWYEYSLRRLQENPRLARYTAADILGRFMP